ncbi:hypothetical protein LPJ61_006253, partial [Coemansia biformis]
MPYVMDEDAVLEDFPPAVLGDLEDNAVGLPRLASPSDHGSLGGGGISFGGSPGCASTDSSSSPDGGGADVGPDPPATAAPATPACNPGSATAHSNAERPAEPVEPYSELSEGSAPESFIRLVLDQGGSTSGHATPDYESRSTDSSGYGSDSSGYYTPGGGAVGPS